MSKINQYECFIATFEAGSLSAAAQNLNRSPSAISKQLTSLENSLGVRLFDRTNKNVVATKQGQIFYEDCKAILKDIANAEQKVKTDKDQVSGLLKITLPKSLVDSQLFTYLHEFTETYPQVNFNTRVSEELEEFNESDLDFAFRIGQLKDHTRLIASPLKKVRPIFYASRTYISRHGAPSSYEELYMHRVSLPPLKQLSSQVRSWLKKQKFQYNPDKHHTIDDVGAIKSLVINDSCIGIHLDCSLETQIHRGEVVELFSNKPMPAKSLYLLYRKAAHEAAHISAFKNFMKQQYERNKSA